MAYDVFLSYSSKDKYAADAACAVLERNGIRVWMAPRDILPGLGWDTSIIEAINYARVMVLVLSGNANISPQIELEVERAINKGLQIIPFRIEDVEPSEALEYFISAAHSVDAFTKPLEQHLDRLAEVVRRVIDVKYGKVGAPAEAEAARRTENEPGGREQEQAAKLVAEEGEQRKAEWAAERTERERRGSAAPQSEKWFVAAKRPVGKDVAGFVVLALLGISLALVILRPSPLSVSAVGTEPANKKSGAEPGAVDLLVRDAFKKGNEAYTAKDYAQAMSWYRKAADQGNAVAQANIGWLYENGQGVAQDYAQAMSWSRKAADQGDALAQNNIGVLYEKGWGVAQDYAQAMSWYRKAADQGNAMAQTNLGWLYEKGWGVAQDYAQAMSWSRKAADQGNALAQNNIGVLYEKGWGVAQDYAQAMSWYRKAADQGNAMAQTNLGWLYLNGWGVAQDYAQAMSWYRKAADQGDALAQNNIGVLYEKGWGVAQDYAQAMSWYRKAADQGNALAQKNMQRMAPGSPRPSTSTFR